MDARPRLILVLRRAVFGVAAAGLAHAAPPAQGQCERWVPGGAPVPGIGFHPQELDPVRAVAEWDPDGPGPEPSRLVVGGRFEFAGATPAIDLAAWDGARWAPLGANLEGPVEALEVYEGDLYAAGEIRLNGQTANWGVVRWNGSEWELAGGILGPVPAMTQWNSLLAAAGLQGVQLWDGHVWASTLGQVQGDIDALAAHAGSLVAGGTISVIGGVNAEGVAAWDGSSWSPLGLGLNSRVHALASYRGDLIAGGRFTEAGGAPVFMLARWDGTAWHSMNFASSLAGRLVEALAVRDDRLLIGGTFPSAGGVAGTAYLAQWDGAEYAPVGPGLDDAVAALGAFRGDLVVAGRLRRAGPAPALGVAAWDGAAWSGFGAGADAPIYALMEHQGRQVAGGAFTSMGPPGSAHIAAWDGIEWSALGSGTNGSVYALGVLGGDLIAAGGFTLAGDAPASRIARWDGAGWNPLGAGVNGPVAAVLSHQGLVIAGGAFALAGGVPVGRIAAWDGAAWSGLGAGVNAPVYALATHDNELYAGGLFTIAGAAPAARIARWDGAAWHALGAGINSPGAIVAAIASFGGGLYAGGSFSTAGTLPLANNIAWWNGATWVSPGAGITNVPTTAGVFVLAMREHQGRLLVAGHFNRAGNYLAGSVGAWTGFAWEPVGAGVSHYSSAEPVVFALGALGPEVTVGGDFGFAGGQPPLFSGVFAANAFARWSRTGAPWIARQPEPVAVTPGGDAAFAVAVPPGYEGLAFVWRRDGAPVVNGPGGASPGGGTVSGADTPTLTIHAARLSDAGAYSVTAQNACGQAASDPAPLTVVCYPDCDGSAALTIGDYICFQTRFALGDPYADCNGDGVRTIADYICFQTLFAQGC